jgi:nicotinamide-nucleotide amidase
MKSKQTESPVSMINAIADKLISNEYTVAVAESVTAGKLQQVFSLAKKAMNFFQGGITAYNIGQKARHLKIDPIHGLSCNCVSEQIAIQMAKEVAHLFMSDWGLGVTGYASPVPEKGIDKVFACYAISFRDKIIVKKKIKSIDGKPDEVIDYYTREIINAFQKAVK